MFVVIARPKTTSLIRMSAASRLGQEAQRNGCGSQKAPGRCLLRESCCQTTSSCATEELPPRLLYGALPSSHHPDARRAAAAGRNNAARGPADAKLHTGSDCSRSSAFGAIVTMRDNALRSSCFHHVQRFTSYRREIIYQKLASHSSHGHSCRAQPIFSTRQQVARKPGRTVPHAASLPGRYASVRIELDSTLAITVVIAASS